MVSHPDMTGLAALSICESLLLALVDREILDQSEVRGLLEDAAATHRNAERTATNPEVHRAAADLLDSIISGRDSLRHLT